MISEGERLRAAAGHQQVRVRASAAADPAAPPDLLAALARDASRTVRRVVAGRPETPGEALGTLVDDPDRQTREALAGNPGAPVEVLVALVGDPHWAVRYGVLENPAGGERVRRALCASDDRHLRGRLAGEPDLSDEIVALLLADPSPEVRAALGEATEDADVLATLLTDPDPKVRAAATMNRNATAEQRRAMVRDPSWGVRNAVIWGMSTWGWGVPEEDLLLLARDRSVNVRYWLANLAGSTRTVYEILAADPDRHVAATAERWLLSPDDPLFPADDGLGELGELFGLPLATQGHFERPDQLGRPIPHGLPGVTAEQLPGALARSGREGLA
jgi:hypothetical protein